MAVAFYTTDLFPGREHLMPWRTILEIAQYLNNQNIKCILSSTYKCNFLGADNKQ